MKLKAVIKENYQGAPMIKYNGDTLDITMTVYSEDFNRFMKIWKREQEITIEVQDE